MRTLEAITRYDWQHYIPLAAATVTPRDDASLLAELRQEIAEGPSYS